MVTVGRQTITIEVAICIEDVEEVEDPLIIKTHVFTINYVESQVILLSIIDLILIFKDP